MSLSTLQRSRSRHISKACLETLEARQLLSFSPAASFSVGGNPQEVATGDFNGDGHLDLATLNQVDAIQYTRTTVSVLPGDGTGGFGAAINSNVGLDLYTDGDPYWAEFSLTVADFDNDGHLDLAIATPFQNEVTGNFGGNAGVSLGNGDGTFRAATYIPGQSAVEAVVAGDFNNDGNSDLAVTGYAPTLSLGEYYEYAQVLLGNGHGDFATSIYSTSWWDGSYFELAVGDLNRDGMLDAVGVAGQWDGSGIVLMGNGGAHGVFADYYGFGTTSGSARDVAVGDFTGDGIPDLVVSGGDVEILANRGDGIVDYPPITHAANGDLHTGVAVADFNGDGKLDAVTSDADTGTVSELGGNGNGTLTYAAAFAVGSSPAAVAVGDFNGDGRPDVAAANAGSNNVSILLNDNHWTIRNYVGPSGGNWSTAGNWSPLGVPSAGDFAVTISGKSVNLSTSATVASLTLTGGASLVVGSSGNRVLRTSALSIDVNSKLDLNDNALILDYTGASPASAVRDYLVSGRNGGAWNGPGLASSSAGAASRRALGYADNNSLATPRTAFAGQSVDATSILIKYTYLGDADLDGDADGVDIGIWATHFTG
ncbi:MAG TPA: VCBS repeat-containing protein, partial [Tepidisphaeraceae bacterium]